MYQAENMGASRQISLLIACNMGVVANRIAMRWWSEVDRTLWAMYLSASEIFCLGFPTPKLFNSCKTFAGMAFDEQYRHSQHSVGLQIGKVPSMTLNRNRLGYRWIEESNVEKICQVDDDVAILLPHTLKVALPEQSAQRFFPVPRLDEMWI